MRMKRWHKTKSQNKYLEQFKRMERWYNRFDEINQGKVHNRQSEYYQDNVYAFFLNCYHLKDWIKNDESIGDAKTKVEGFINSNKDLKLCADICNSIKHLELKKFRSNQNPKLGPRRFKLNLSEDKSIISVVYIINTKSGAINAFELAKSCLQAWKEFIETNINNDIKV